METFKRMALPEERTLPSSPSWYIAQVRTLCRPAVATREGRGHCAAGYRCWARRVLGFASKNGVRLLEEIVFLQPRFAMCLPMMQLSCEQFDGVNRTLRIQTNHRRVTGQLTSASCIRGTVSCVSKTRSTDWRRCGLGSAACPIGPEREPHAIPTGCQLLSFRATLRRRSWYAQQSCAGAYN